MERDLVVLLAIGTVGDVVPVLNLAKRLIPRSQCTLITHHEHQVSQLKHHSWIPSMIEHQRILFRSRHPERMVS